MLTRMCLHTGGSHARTTGRTAQRTGGKGYVKALLRHAMGGPKRRPPQGVDIPSAAKSSIKAGSPDMEPWPGIRS
jgi:hypothetical protein